MYPELDPIGWYQGVKGHSDEPNKDDLVRARDVMSKFCGANHLMFVFNLTSEYAEKNKCLPLFCYEREAQKDQFVKIDFNLASSDAEQIAVDDIYQAVDAKSLTSHSSQSMKAPLNALKLLRNKLNFLITAVEKSPEVRANHDFMRRLNQIVN